MTGGSLGVKEDAARAVLRDVWRQGHETVELRQDGKRLIFFCTLCSTRCYSDSALSDHLNGNFHARRYSASISSPSVPWPFNDGLVFLFPSSKATLSLALHNHSQLEENCESNPFPLKWIGCGHVYMRVLQSAIPTVKAVWCCWLGGEQEQEQEQQSLPECEYAIVSFPYNHALGRGGVGIASNINAANSSPVDIDKKKRKKKGRPAKHPHPLFQVEVSAAPHLDKGAEVAVASTSNSNSNEADDGSISALPLRKGKEKENVSNGALRRAFRRERLKALERLCFICHQQMLPGKDVATLLNRKSGLMACSSRNRRGSFHVFHTSCLIDWVLLCESKIWLSHLNGGKGSRKSRRSVLEQRRKQISKGSSSSCGSVFCPECQGTGLKTRGGQLEVPRYRLAQVFDWILELIQSRKSWIDHPEQLQECATGLLFCPSESSQGNVMSMLLLHFYGFNGAEFGARAMLGRPHSV